MEKMILKVPEMSCMHCVQQIEKALRALDQVQNIEVRLEDKTVHLSADPVMREEIIAAIENIGFDVES